MAVIVFAIVASEASRPLRTYNRIAFVVLILSCVPDLAFGFGLIRGEGWALAIVLNLIHVAVWAVTVSMLTYLTTSKKPAPLTNELRS